MPVLPPLKNKRFSSSFRDPAGFVLLEDERILRVLSEEGARNYRSEAECGLITALEQEGLLLPVRPTGLSSAMFGGEANGCVLEQTRLPFVSYPYEWCFEGLKAAALLHLDVLLLAARFGFTMSDATAFNIQFIGAKPIFIDVGSFVPRKSGEYWRGYRQFCEQFINPLVLQSATGVPFNALYRGNVRGVPTEYLARMLRLHHRLHLRTMFHVVLHARFIERASVVSDHGAKNGGLSDDALEVILRDLRHWIAALSPKSNKSTWTDYTCNRIYKMTELAQKLEFVQSWTSKWSAGSVLDLGSNTGEAARMAVQAGARHVVGLEQDEASTNISFVEAAKSGSPILPLVMDLTNPSPSQGWHNKEWMSLEDRNRSDMVYALAILHHLTLGQGIPMERVVAWICGLGRRGVVEFVSLDDPMAATIRARVQNTSNIYSREHFLEQLDRYAVVTGEQVITETGRSVFAYEAK